METPLSHKLARRGIMLPRWRVLALMLIVPSAMPLVARSAGDFELRSTIAFTSTRDNLGLDIISAAEIYLCDEDGTNVRRLTENTAGDGFAALSPDGKKVVFDSRRNRRESDPIIFSELFVMNTDGSEQTLLLRGSSATWSPDSKNIAYHASASGTGVPIRNEPGAPTTDSDIFVLNVDDWLIGAGLPVNITNSPESIESDADWSPDGQTIVLTSHPVTDSPTNPIHTEIYRINADGTGPGVRLTDNLEEERAASWSPDGTRLVFMCRRGGPDAEICTMNADGSDFLQLTDNSVTDATSTFSPDGQKIVFHRPVAGLFQLWVMHADGTGQVQLTQPPGLSLFANWGELRVNTREWIVQSETPADAARSPQLDPVYPNPFRAGVSLRFAVPASGRVRLAIYNVTGRLEATVLDQELPAGSRSVSWDGLDRMGRPVPSGAYFARLESGGKTHVQKLFVAR